MKQTSKPNPASSGALSEYERLLSIAQAAQTAADRAVADLAAIKRTMAEAPRIMQLRRDELARAQEALERAEADVNEARQQIAGKQAEAAQLIEVAAEAQRALAKALISQDVMPEGATWDARSIQTPSPSPQPWPNAAPQPTNSSFDATLGRNRYTPTPAMHPADLHAEVMEYMAERDALCPSCGHSLRGIETARCPGCKLQLSVSVLKSVRASPLEAPKSIWVVRVFAAIAMLLSAYLALVVFGRSKPFGCGVGSDCYLVARSAWSKLFGIPVAAFSVPIYLALLLATGFVHIGLTDRTRRRAWNVISFTALTAGLAGVWFIIVQVAFLRAICPHCLVVDVLGIVIASIVLAKAPLGRAEALPERAAGPITIERRKAVMLAGVAAVMVTALAAVHFATADRYTLQDRLQYGTRPKPKPVDDGGLLMKPLDIEMPAIKNDPSKQPDKAPLGPLVQPPPVPPATPAAGDGPGGLLLPGLDINPGSQPPAAPKPPEPATPDKNDKTGEPAPKADDKRADDKKDTKDTKDTKDKKDGGKPDAPKAKEPKFDFSNTLPTKPLNGDR